MPCASTLPKAPPSAGRAAISLMRFPPLALPSSGSCGRRPAPSQPATSYEGVPAKSQRSLGFRGALQAPAGIDLTGGLGLAPGGGGKVGEDAVHLRIDSQANA